MDNFSNSFINGSGVVPQKNEFKYLIYETPFLFFNFTIN